MFPRIVRLSSGRSVNGLLAQADTEQLMTRQTKRPNRYSRFIGQSSGVFDQCLESSGVGLSLRIDDAEAIDHVLVGQEQKTHSQRRIRCKRNYYRIEREGQIHELVIP